MHEHPAGATSWNMPEMVSLLARGEVDAVTMDMCMFGMKATKDGKEYLVQKKTRIVSSSQEVLKNVGRKCPNAGGEKVHEHVVLEGERTRKAQVYPR